IGAAARDAAATLAALDDANLAARADDIRSIGRRAIRVALGRESTPEPTDGWQEVVLVAPDLGPAAVAEFGAGVGGVALAGGVAERGAAPSRARTGARRAARAGCNGQGAGFRRRQDAPLPRRCHAAWDRASASGARGARGPAGRHRARRARDPAAGHVANGWP